MSRTFGGGSTDSVATNLTSHTTQRSYSMWVYRTGDGGGNLGRMFDKRTAGAEVELMYNSAASTAYFYQRDVVSGTNGAWSVTRPSANAWHHIAVVYDSGSASNVPTIYFDGSSQTLLSSTQPVGTIATNTDGYVIGNRTNDNLRNWAGNLCEFAIWSSLLGSSDITSLNGGTSPLLVQSGSLVAYWPLRCGNSPEPDLTGGTSAATVTGTVYAPSIDPSAPPLPCPQQNPAYRTRLVEQAVNRAASF